MPWPFLVLGGLLLLVLLAGWWFDRTRQREGRGQYEVRGNKQQMVGVPVAGEMIEKPPELRLHHSSSMARDEADEGDDAEEAGRWPGGRRPGGRRPGGLTSADLAILPDVQRLSPCRTFADISLPNPHLLQVALPAVGGRERGTAGAGEGVAA